MLWIVYKDNTLLSRRTVTVTDNKKVRQEIRGAANNNLPLLPSGPGGVRQSLLARFLARLNVSMQNRVGQ